MAVFGRDFYGLSKYGANVHTEFDVNPFNANPDGYGAIRVTWHSPSGAWQALRLLKSRSGYAVDESDGMVVLESTTSTDEYVDQGLLGGTWYYYTIFVKDDTGTWNRAGATSSLAVKRPWSRSIGQIVGDQYDTQTVPFGHAELMWERIPAYYRFVRRDQASVTDEYYLPSSPQALLLDPGNYDQENQHLRSFLSVLGWGMDYLHNYQETLLSANDPHAAHLQDVNRLAEEMGIDFEYGVPASVMRAKVANAALLARRRGTLEGLRDVAALSTGWDVDISVGPNLFLNRDQSEFANPVFAEWDSGVNYATGQKIQYEGRIFTALVGAYGTAQRPPETGTNTNTWWTVTTNSDVTTLHRADTDSVVTWQGWKDGTTQQDLALAIGVSDPISGVGQESNALAVRNGTGSHGYDLVGAANLAGSTVVLPGQPFAIRQGIPIPRPVLWSANVEYGLGAIVVHRGGSYRSIGTSLGQAPNSTSIYWEKVGVDIRPTFGYSFYAHGPLTGTGGTGGVAVTPGMAFFDKQGNLILDQVTPAPMTAFVFDTFNHAFGTPDIHSMSGVTTWAVTGTWHTDSIGTGDDQVAYPTSTTGTATITIPTALTAYRVGATFAKAASSGFTDSLLIRYVDANNYMRVTRTLVQKRVTGTFTTVASGFTIKDGDRVVMKMDDTANTFTLFVNGISAATGPLTGGTTPFKHGMMVS